MAVSINNVLEEMAVPLKGFVRKHIANEEDAEEITQDVLLKILNGIGGLKDNGRIQPWIYRIARNAITDYYRKSDRYIEFVELFEEVEENNNEDQNLNKEIAGCLKAMIENLPDKYKDAILLVEFNDLTNRELGDMMGISISGAKSRVQRARKMLKEMLTSCCSLEFDVMGNIIDYKHNMSKCKYC